MSIKPSGFVIENEAVWLAHIYILVHVRITLHHTAVNLSVLLNVLVVKPSRIDQLSGIQFSYIRLSPETI